MNQLQTPLADSLAAQAGEAYIPFDVPGHKGRLSVLQDYFGETCLALDKNSRPGLDYLCQPRGVIRQAQQLAAEAFGAQNAFFMVGGTSSAVQAMVMTACAPGQKIILPRNVHYSVINAVILAGAVPIYIDPHVNNTIGISLGITTEDVRRCILEHPTAKAVLINNPTYYGICSDVAGIVQLAHSSGMLVLADEAHGTHFYFGSDLPRAAIHCGADMAAVSMHKTGGSLTQSSILLVGPSINPEHVRSVINLTCTTSASYLLMASLDLARKFLATEGRNVLNQIRTGAIRTRQRINQIGGYYAFGPEIIDGGSVFDFDPTKISVNTFGVGLAGIEVYTRLREDYHIQLEFGDTGNILALSTLADTDSQNDLLVEALQDLRQRYADAAPLRFSYEYIAPTPVIAPRDAFYARKKSLPIEECLGMICGDAVMCYPPGIPILAPGERITAEIIEHIVYASEKGCSITGLSENLHINVVME